MMKLKTVIQMAIVIALCASNYMMILKYYDEYVPDNFDIYKMLDIRYRCIRFFHDKNENSYRQKICQPYYYDYVAFNLEKSRYIYMYYAHNLIVISIFTIFHLVF